MNPKILVLGGLVGVVSGTVICAVGLVSDISSTKEKSIKTMRRSTALSAAANTLMAAGSVAVVIGLNL